MSTAMQYESNPEEVHGLKRSVTIQTNRRITMWKEKGSLIRSKSKKKNHSFFTYLWLFSKQQFRHRNLPHPGPNSSWSSSPSFIQGRWSSWSTSLRLFPAITLEVTVKCGSEIILVFEEFSERCGEPPIGDGDGVGDHVKCGGGGWEAAEALHVRETHSTCNRQTSTKQISMSAQRRRKKKAVTIIN